MSLDGVEIIVNGSGSYMELRKAYVAVELIRSGCFISVQGVDMYCPNKSYSPPPLFHNYIFGSVT